jgi:hypothetical protein
MDHPLGQPAAQWVEMVMDRLHKVEHQIDKLQKENDDLSAHIFRLNTRLYLTDHSDYMSFNDGNNIFWQLSEEPLMYTHEWSDICSMRPLDEPHWNSIIFPSGGLRVSVPVKTVPSYKTSRYIGKPGQPVTLRQLVSQIHDLLNWVAYDDDDNYNETLQAHLSASVQADSFYQLNMQSMHLASMPIFDGIRKQQHEESISIDGVGPIMELKTKIYRSQILHPLPNV